MADKVYDAIDALLDAIEREGAARPDFAHAIPRGAARKLIDAAASLYRAREGSAASIYAAVALEEAAKEAGLRSG